MSQVRSLNRVILVGRVGKNPDITVVASSGRQLAKFSLATNEGYFDKNSNAWKDMPTEWHNIVAWGPLAQKVEKSVNKGDMVLIEGRIHTRKWQDKNGQDRWNTDIQAENMIILDRRKEQGVGGAGAPYPSANAGKNSFPDSADGGLPPFAAAPEGDERAGEEEDPF
ncbi:MAG: single-stranded DNA-binding protein [Candidatus Aminicenantes bacterium]|nr:single-stranded DNA-binding protein [Candidatus Aminicenantes bacterium]